MAGGASLAPASRPLLPQLPGQTLAGVATVSLMPETNAWPTMVCDLRFFPIAGKPTTLTGEQVARFNRDGYIFPIDLFNAREAQRKRAYFDKLIAMAAADGGNSYAINGWHGSCRGLYDLVINKTILDYVQDIIGPDIVCRMTHYFAKDPGDAMSVYWHQDASFWALTPSKVVTVWLAIDDADEENGAMRLYRGSHRHGIIPFEWVTDEESGVLNQHVHHPERFGEPVSVNLRAGQCSLHTNMLLHGSLPNPSQRRRCGLTIRYFPPEVRTNAGSDGAPASRDAIICRGSDPTGYWQHIEPPEGDSPPAA